MKFLITNVIVWSFIMSQSVYAGNADYTNRHNTVIACELFATAAYQAADNFNDGVVLNDILNLIDGSPVSDSKKHRAFQAIQFVWKNQLANPVMAYTLAMGTCLEPKKEMAPLDEPWITSPRTNKEYF
jgi:hypothetical protein